MSNKHVKKELVKAKIMNARESWDEALWCYKGAKYPATVNRIYYAIYRACLAVLTFEQKIPSKHSAVIGRVNKNFVKTGILPRDAGKYLHKLQTARVESDYKAKKFTSDEVEELMKQGGKVLTMLENLAMEIIEDIDE